MTGNLASIDRIGPYGAWEPMPENANRPIGDIALAVWYLNLNGYNLRHHQVVVRTAGGEFVRAVKATEFLATL